MTVEPAGTPSRSDGKVVLYIEDSVGSQALMGTIIDRMGGAHLCSAMTGAQGLASAAVERPDLILLDLDLPDMAGEDVLTRLRSDESTAGVPVFIISGEAADDTAARIVAMGATGFIVKPVDVRQIMALIDGTNDSQ